MKKYQIFILITLMFVTVLTFYPVLSAGFVNLDDKGLVTDNWKIRSLSPANLQALLFKPHVKLYHPLVNLSYAIEYRLFGYDPYFYHADNLILHLLSVLFVFFIFFRLTKNNFTVSVITALLFACHPMHVEPVAWVSGRKDTLYAFFFLGSWLMYLKSYSYKGKRHTYAILASLILFLCACLSKTMAVTLPAVLILSDWLYGVKFEKKALLRYVPFILAAAVFALSTYMLYYTPNQKSNLTAYTLSVNFVSAHFNVLFYIIKFIIPVKLSALYPYFYDVNANPPPYILYSPALLYGIAVLIMYTLKKTKSVFFGFVFFIVTILPVINIFPTGVASVADRYTYIPFLGFGYIAAAAIFYLLGVFRKTIFKTVLISAVSAVFVIMCFTAHSRAEKWINTMTLFDDIIKNYPGGVARAYADRGIAFIEINRIKDAEKDLEMALYLEANNNVALYTLGTIRLSQKKHNDALYLFSLLPSDDYNLEGAYMLTAQIYYERNQKEKAFFVINHAIKRYPNVFSLYDTLAMFYIYDKNYDKAIENIEKSKRLYPGNINSYIHLAQIYDILGKYTFIEKEYRDGISNCAGKRELLYKLGEFYFVFKDYYKAKEIFLKIVKNNPDDYKSFDYLGNLESLAGNYKKALYYYTLAVSVNNSYSSSYFHRSAAHLNLKNYEQSAADARKALSLGYSMPHNYFEDIKNKTELYYN
ncbi:MAG: tetratricopeptide repeat protein [Endomicrobia bacterium]|nr:tetratricopeptide repeat protein [Endomicrobiia bacterium]